MRLLIITALALLIANGYSLVLQAGNGRAAFAESNYQSNIIRLQDYAFGSQFRAVLVGSSITGRLLPQDFPADFPVANLGLDGSVPATGLKVVLNSAEVPEWILIEANLLHGKPTANDALLLAAMTSPEFRLSRSLPWLRANERPSAVAYTQLKQWNDRRTPGRPGLALALAPGNEQQSNPPDPQTEPKAAIIDLIEKVQARGSKVGIMLVPALYRVEDCQMPAFAIEVAQATGAVLLDLPAELTANGTEIRYSDGLHLVQPSARKVVEVVVSQLDGPGKSSN